jgi:phosphatidylglycerol:prolipoprotein diacylglycerol transferase
MLPVLFHIGNWPVYTYGVMISLGFIVGYYVVSHFAREAGIDEDHVINMLLIQVIGGTLGARLTFVVTYPQFFARDWTDVFRVWKGGLTFLGGAIVAFIGWGIYLKRYRLDAARVLDVFAAACPIGIAIGRLGCLGFGCCYGRPTSLPWGLVFPNTDPLNPPVPRHPTQLYSSLALLAIFLVMLWYRKRPHTKGAVAALFVSLYCLYRFLIEFVREDVAQEQYLFGLTLAQSTCVVFALIAFAFWWFKLRGPAEEAKERG